MSDTFKTTKLTDINTLPTLSSMRLQGRDAALKYDSESKRLYVLEPNYPHEATQVVAYANAGEGWMAMRWVDLGKGHPFERATVQEYVNGTPLLKTAAAASSVRAATPAWTPSWKKPTSAAVPDRKPDTVPASRPVPVAPVADRAAAHINSLFGNLNRTAEMSTVSIKQIQSDLVAGMTLGITGGVGVGTFDVYAPAMQQFNVPIATGEGTVLEIPRGTVSVAGVDLPVYGSLACPLVGGTTDALALKSKTSTAPLVGTVSGNWVLRVSPTATGQPWLIATTATQVALIARSMADAMSAADQLSAKIEARRAEQTARAADYAAMQERLIAEARTKAASFQTNADEAGDAFDRNSPGAKSAMEAMGLLVDMVNTANTVPVPEPASLWGAQFPVLNTLKPGDTVAFTGTVSLTKQGVSKYGKWFLVAFTPDGGVAGKVVAFIKDREYAQLGHAGARYKVTATVKLCGPDQYSRAGNWACELTKCHWGRIA